VSLPARSGPLILLAALIAAAGSRAVPLEVYGQLPALDMVSLSPDGTKIAFIRAVGDERAIAVRSLVDRKLLGVVRIGTKEKVRRLTWIDENRLAILETVAHEGYEQRYKFEWGSLGFFDIAGNRLKHIYPYRGGPFEVRRINGHMVVYFQSGMDIQGEDLDGLAEWASMERGKDSWDWLIDAHGALTADLRYDEKKEHWTLWTRPEGKWRQVGEGQASVDVPQLIGIGPTPDMLLMEVTEQDQTVWKSVSLKDGSQGPLIAGGRMLNHPIEDRLSHQVIGASYLDDYYNYVFFDPAMQAHWDAIVGAFKDDHVRYVSASADLKKILVLVDGPKYGYQYELVDLNTHKSDWVGDVYEGITQALPTRRVTYAAGDGLEIPAYLTTPRGRTERNLPLVVLVHGGPVARDDAHFEWWPQALADQGYAVLQPNYRASSVDRRLMQAGYGEFGRKMQTDLSDGVRYLVKEGIVDPARVCIVGASYGGYAALAGVTLDPGVYRCAVSVAGVSNLYPIMENVTPESPRSTTQPQRYWDRLLGVKRPSDPVVSQISPIDHVGAVTVPVLLIHGKDDAVVNYSQSDNMYAALKRAKKTVEFIDLPREDHWLSRSETRLQMLQATAAFLRKYNPPD